MHPPHGQRHEAWNETAGEKVVMFSGRRKKHTKNPSLRVGRCAIAPPLQPAVKGLGSSIGMRPNSECASIDHEIYTVRSYSGPVSFLAAVNSGKCLRERSVLTAQHSARNRPRLAFIPFPARRRRVHLWQPANFGTLGPSELLTTPHNKRQ